MRSPSKRPLAFVAEYQFGDDNVLTATHHEELRLKNEERVRNAKSILKLEGLTLTGDTSPTYNLKRIQQEQDRLDEIDQHNLILLDRLEKIHAHVPKQFDVSHHSEAVQNAPRATNAIRRRRQHEQIELENERMVRRLNKVKGTFDLKKLAADAERHHYFSDQLSKIGRRRKAQATVKHLANLSALKHDEANRREGFYVYDHNRQNEDDDDDDARTRDGPPPQRTLPPVRASAARKYAPQPIQSPALTSTAKAISASYLLNGFK